jgi:hypothetical protein
VPRLRRSVGVRVLGAGTVFAASLLGGFAANAQSASGDDALLSPKLQGDPRKPSAFRKTPPSVAQAQTRAATPLGQIPDYGYQPGVGAGSTGYDSSNNPRRNARARGQGKGAPAPKSPTVSVGAAPVPPAQNGVLAPSLRPPRKGAPPVASEPERIPVVAAPRRRPAPEQDAFEPTGIHAGSFFLRPAVELSGGANSNPSAAPGGRGSSVYVISPELIARSDWSRHELTATLRGSYTGYGERFVPDLNRPSADMKVNARIDATSFSHIDFESRFLLGTDNPGSPNL